ncbi:MAG: 50S ribosomal protein L25 [Eubacteriales bacterium]|nr:50S ribosomal protein L25 [Eubacteriales bacterium]
MTTLKAEKRTLDVKAKRLRREGYATGNLFGRKIEGSIPLKIEKRELERALKSAGKGSQVQLTVDGETYNALIKEIDYNSMACRVDEIDFQALVSNEKVHSVAEIILVNHEEIAGGVLQESLSEVSYRAYPSALVDKIRVDVSSLKVGDTLRVKDLDIARNKDIDLTTDPEAVVATVTAVHNVVPEEPAETDEKTE